MTNDLISREVLAKMEVKEKKAFDLGYMIGYEQGRRDEIDAVPVVHVCSGIDNPLDPIIFCPSYGATMDGERKEDKQ